jgi:hypothetical protein
MLFGHLCGISSGKHAGLSLMPEAVTLPGDGHDVGMVQEPIQQGRRQRAVLGEGCVPLPEGQIELPPKFRLPRVA